MLHSKLLVCCAAIIVPLTAEKFVPPVFIVVTPSVKDIVDGLGDIVGEMFCNVPVALKGVVPLKKLNVKVPSMSEVGP
mgnify:CR=1 FL=1